MDVYKFEKLHAKGRRRLISRGDNRFHFAIAQHKERAVFISGGYLNKSLSPTVLRFCLKSFTFELIQPLCWARRSHASIATDKHLFAIGGSDGGSDLDSIEVLDL